MRKMFTILILISLTQSIRAGDWSHFGILLSTKEVGFISILPSKDGSRSVFRLGADLEKVMKGESGVPGAMLQYFLEYPIVAKNFHNGVSMNLLAGPGVSAGYTRDMESEFGLTAGLAGETCMEFRFDRPFVIRFGFSATLAVHTEKSRIPHAQTLKFYKNGIFNAWMPELSLVYRF